MSREEKLSLMAEMGLDPYALDTLSDDDMRSLYAGYQRRVTTLGNLFIVAINRALTGNNEPFTIPKGQLSREETFRNLGIKESDA